MYFYSQVMPFTPLLVFNFILSPLKYITPTNEPAEITINQTKDPLSLTDFSGEVVRLVKTPAPGLKKKDRTLMADVQS